MQERTNRVTELNRTVRELEHERLMVATEISVDKMTRLASLDALIMRYELEKLMLDCR